MSAWPRAAVAGCGWTQGGCWMASEPSRPAAVPSPAKGEDVPRQRELSWPRGLALSVRMLARDWRAGELRVLVVGLLIAVSSLTTVAFFADRVRQALSLEASQLLGADLVIVSDRPLDAAFTAEAQRRGLHTVETVRFPSMALHEGRSQLSEIK